MKQRAGFVSNSSSSSFILVFDQLPKSVEELTQVLSFGGASEEFTHEQYAQRIFDDIQMADDPSDDEIKSLLSSTLFYQLMDLYRKAWDAKDAEEQKRLDEEADNRLNELTNARFEEFKKKHSGKCIRVVRYSDNDGTFDSNLEHGHLFENIEHIHISQH